MKRFRGGLVFLALMLVLTCTARLAHAAQEFKLFPSGVHQANSNFGAAVGISGNMAIVGANAAANGGAAYVYRFDGSKWVETQMLVPADNAPNGYFGYSVGISGNYAIIGAPRFGDIGNGAAYIYFFDGKTWVEKQKLMTVDGAPNYSFGEAVAISGTNAIVGASYDSNVVEYGGSAYIYSLSGAVWNQAEKLVAPDTNEWGFFGIAVAISGNHAIVGKREDSIYDLAKETGSAYIFDFNGSHWLERQKVKASDGYYADNYGFAVAISDNIALVGAAYASAPGQCDNGDPYLCDFTQTMQGAVYLYALDGKFWHQRQILTASDAEAGNFFGNALAISGNYAVIGSEGNQAGLYTSSSFGAAYIFQLSNGRATEVDKLVAAGRTGGEILGTSVAISGGMVVAGAPGDIFNQSNTGTASVFKLDTDHCSKP